MKKIGFFKVSIETLKMIAYKIKNPDLLAGFLVLARHGTSNTIAGKPPFTFTGAGVNSIKEKVGVGEATAKGIFDRLKQEGFIQPVAKEIKLAYPREAHYELMQAKTDLDLPHSFVDGLGKTTDSAIKRIRNINIAPGYDGEVENVTRDELRLDILVLLLEMYVKTNMAEYGGISPFFLFRKWKIEVKREKNGNIEWSAIPEDKNSFKSAIKNTFQHLAVESIRGRHKNLEYPDNISARFWNAFQNIEKMGLIYEAVTVFDAPPEINQLAKMICTIRINDYHAGVGKDFNNPPDPSLLDYDIGGGFYTQAINDRDDPEQIRFRWPDKSGTLIGIYRPRFRAINQSTGIWKEQDTNNVDQIYSKLNKQEIIADV